MKPGLVVVALTAVAVLGATLARAASLTVTTEKLTGFNVCTVSGVSSGSAVIDDYVQQDKPSANNGAAPAALDVQSSSGKNWRAFVRFDLSACSPAIPATATVKQAQLRMYATSGTTTPRTYEVRKALASWTETGLTWANQPAVAASATDAVACCALSNTYYTWTVTPDVQSFVNTPAANFGFRISDSAEDSAIAVSARFRPHDGNPGNKYDQAPQLIVTYG